MTFQFEKANHLFILCIFIFSSFITSCSEGDNVHDALEEDTIQSDPRPDDIIRDDATADNTEMSFHFWARSYGQEGLDISYSVQQTSDGDFAVAGSTSFIDTAFPDLWVLKLDASGNVIWQKAYGGTDYFAPIALQETADDGYIIAGVATSLDIMRFYAWILKLDVAGNMMWQKQIVPVFFHDNEFSSVQQTRDNGYIAAGHLDSWMWVAKLDANGNIEWQKTYGHNSEDPLSSIRVTSDFGYILAGRTKVFGSDKFDIWILKLDSDGNSTWQKAYGGADDEKVRAIEQTADFGYIVAGSTKSFGAGLNDLWILKLDTSGNIEWQKAFGGAEEDQGLAVAEDSEENFVVAGYAESFGQGDKDCWVLKIDAGGNVVWEKTYGAENNDKAFDVKTARDGGYVITGETDRSGSDFPDPDIWVLRLNENGMISTTCPDNMISDSSSQETATPVTPEDTDVLSDTSNAELVPTSLTSVDTTTTPVTQCGE